MLVSPTNSLHSDPSKPRLRNGQTLSMQSAVILQLLQSSYHGFRANLQHCRHEKSAQREDAMESQGPEEELSASDKASSRAPPSIARI